MNDSMLFISWVIMSCYAINRFKNTTLVNGDINYY